MISTRSRRIRSGLLPLGLSAAFALASVGLAGADSPPDPDCSATTSPVTTVHGQAVGVQLSCVPTDLDATTVTYAITTVPTTGTFDENFNGNYTWTPPATFAGTRSVAYTATDDSPSANVTSGTVTLESTNAAPACVGVEISVHTGTASSGTAFNCSDADDFTGLTYATTGTPPQHGTVSNIGSDGSFTYTAAAGFSGADSFQYVANDGIADSAPSTVTVSIDNNAPACAVPFATSTHFNTNLDIFASCSDGDFSDNPLTPTVIAGQGPSHGSLGTFNTATQKWVYTPNHNYTGPDSFKYTVTDGTATSATYTQDIAVTNTKPVCFTSDNIIRLGKTAQLFETCVDPDSDPITVATSSVTNGNVGTITNDGFGNYTVPFTPTALGGASFVLKANDGIVDSDPAPVTLNVTVNHAPVCFPPFAQHTKINTLLQFSDACFDTDYQDQTLTYSIVTPPPVGQGSLSPVVPEFGGFSTNFTPANNFTGATSFTWRASDGSLNGGDMVQKIHVANTPFCSPAPTIVLRAGRNKGFEPECTFPEDFSGSNVSYVITTPPAKGTLSPSGSSPFAQRTYTASQGTDGADSFGFQLTSSGGNSPIATQLINITPTANEAPSCTSNTFNAQNVFRGRANAIPVVSFWCFDPDSDPLTAVKNSDGAHGTVSDTGGSLTYTPAIDYLGADSFSYHVTDSLGASSAVVDYAVDVKLPQKPTCQPVTTFDVRPTKSKTFSLFCSSIQGDPQTYEVAEQPAGNTGTVTKNGSPSSNVFQFTAGSTNGPTTFKVKGVNAIGDSDLITVTANVTPTANEAPICSSNGGFPQAVTKNAITVLDLATYCFDPDGDTLKFVRDSQPLSLGTVDPAGPATQLSFTAGGTLGTTSFTFHAVDDQATPKSSPVTSFSVEVANSVVPTCSALPQLDIRPGQTKTITFNCTSPGGGALSYEIVTPPVGGQLTPPGTSQFASRQYTAPGTAGPQQLTYRAVRNGTPSINYVLQINVSAAANDVPQCSGNETRQTVANNHASILATDDFCFDFDDDALTFAATSTPAHGSVSVVNGKLSYTPTAGYEGPDSVLFTANDGHGGTSSPPNSWLITVAPPTPPTCTAGAPLSVRPNQSKSVELHCTDNFGDPLTFKIQTQPTKGTLSPNGDSGNAFRSYTAGGTVGGDSFTYFATSINGTATAVTRTITISTTANEVPTCASNSGFAESAATAVQKTLAPFCGDPDFDLLTYTKISEALHGTVSDAGGVLKYTSFAGYTGPDQFQYSASDGHGGTTAVTTHFIQVVPATGPTCTAGGTISLRPGATKPVILGCSDPAGTPVSYVIDTQPAHGTLTPSGNSSTSVRSYQAANTGYTGADSLSYHATNVNGTSPTVVQNFTIDPAANVAPTCAPTTSVSAGTATATPVAAPCSDGDGDTMTPVKLSDPLHGTVTGPTNGQLVYTSTAGYAGSDSFTFKVTDGHTGESNTVTANITVEAAPNNVPVCTTVNDTTKHDVAKLVHLTCTDADGGDSLTITIVSPPSVAAGSVGAVTAGGDVTFTPAAAFVGNGVFTFKATDGKADSAPATATVAVTNNAPTCTPVPDQNAVAGVEKTISITCSDVDGDAMSVSSLTGPTHGTLGAVTGTGNTRTVGYTSEATYSGADSFTFRITDGVTQSTLQTVNISVNRLSACAAIADGAVTNHTAKPLTITCTDPDAFPNAALTYSVVDNPQHGTLGAFSGTGPSRSITYTPAGDYAGADSFTVKANDGRDDSPVRTIDLVVAADGVPACAAPALQTVEHSKPKTTPAIACVDAEGDSYTLSTGTAPTKGAVTYAQGAHTATFTPSLHASGTDSFTVVAADGHGGSSAPITVDVDITANHAPTCDAKAATVKAHTGKPIPLACADLDGDVLSLAIVDGPAHGTLGAITGGSVTYTPSGDYAGPDTFTYRAGDGAGGALSDAATVTLTVEANAVPTCQAVSAEVGHETAKTLTLSCADADADGLTLATAVSPGHGSLGSYDSAAKTVTYTPASGFAGTDTFTYRATDGHGGQSAPATVTLTVAAATPAATATPTPSPIAAVSPTPSPTPNKGPTAADLARVKALAATLASGAGTGAGKLDPKTSALTLGSVGATQCPNGCVIAVVITAPKKIGSATVTITKGGTKKITIKLNAAGKKLLKKKKKLKATVSIVIQDPSGATSTVTKKVTLKYKKK
jgi:hypothetical protein